MKLTSKLLTTAALLIAIATAASAQHSGSHGSTMDMPAIQKMMQDMMPTSSDPASTKGFKEAHMRMMKDMHVAFTGNPDVDFRAQHDPAPSRRNRYG